MLTTPAMASEPYCAAAPSRRPSMWAVGEAGNGIDVGARRATADRLLVVDQSLLVASLPVDQNQRLVGTERAQGRRADGVGAIADEGRREVGRRLEELEDLA